MNLFKQAKDFFDGKSDNTNFTGSYVLGKLNSLDWELCLEICVDEEDRDVMIYPFIVVPKYDKGVRTNAPGELFEIDYFSKKFFASDQKEFKCLLNKVQNKLNFDENLEMIIASEWTINALEHRISLFGYNVSEVKKELEEKFNLVLQ